MGSRDDCCGNCLAFDRRADSLLGLCRLAPPVRLPRAFAEGATPGNRVRSERLVWGWPEVAHSDWCLEHVRRPA
jgi:hypothetical protein